MHYLRMFFVFIFMVASIAISQATTAAKTTKEAIFKSIVNLNGSINATTAHLYANIIDKYSTAYGVDPLLVVSIARVESNFVLNKKNGYYKDVYTKTGEVLKKYITTDYCMMQINHSNLARLQLNAKKLLLDPDYCIRTGVKILASLKPYQKHESYWWTRYNSPNIKQRTLYKKNILRFYKKATQELV